MVVLGPLRPFRVRLLLAKSKRSAYLPFLLWEVGGDQHGRVSKGRNGI
jgi:hypothetical protein